MNFLYWIFRRRNIELKIALTTLAILVFLPAISLVVVASSGLAIVGQALAAVNPVTHLVDIFDPNGHKVREVTLSTVWPVDGYVSDEFGTFEKFRFEAGLGIHTGIDIANERNQGGAPVTPFMDGKVILSHDTDDNTCGKYVKLDHGDGITSLYCHMSATAGLAKDTVVKPGDVIGYVGTTGASTGNHLHFQIMIYGITINPRIFMVGEPRSTVFP